MLYEHESTQSVDTLCDRIHAATSANGFGVLGVHNLREKMQAKGVAFEQECRIIEVCNPVQAKKVLETNMSIANALPCRICVYEEAGKVKVSTLRPTAVLSLFATPGLNRVAREVEAVIIKIIDTACRG